MIAKLYNSYVLKYPIWILSFFIITASFFGYFATNLKIDANAETLLLENDKDLRFAREISTRYQSSDVLILTISPKQDLFSSQSLDLIKELSNDLEKLENTSSITSILTVPLFQSPIRGIASVLKSPITLKSDDVDRKMAKEELLHSPLYKNILVSKDFKTTAIILSLKKDKIYNDLLKRKNDYYLKHSKEDIVLTKQIKEHRSNIVNLERENISSIRNIIKKYENKASIFLGGISMITSDIVGFIKSDIVVYGSILILLLTFVLWVIFRQMIWVFLPLFICFLSVTISTGILGLLHWEVTIISSNFIAIQLIITISIVLHLIIKYMELSSIHTKTSQKRLILNTMLSKLKASFFAIITTIVGFGSLVFSDILPIINFGIMVSIGILISLIVSFLVFPAILIKLPNIRAKRVFLRDNIFIKYCAHIAINKNKTILLFTFFVIIISLFGTSKLFVENSFINYFKKDTDIYKGMKVIDEKLGGTTPLDIILTFPNDIESADDSDELDGFLDDSDNDEYWFSESKMKKIIKIHNYLESINEIGSVSSLAGVLKLGKTLNDNKHLSGLELALLYKKLPLEYKNLLLAPYINIEKNQARFSVRIIDSKKDLRRNELLKRIKKDIQGLVDKKDNIKLSGLMVLYNNMLQSLFSSQIKTLGFVAILIFFMFLISFKSLSISIIAISCNIIPIGVIFAVMGIGEIPLDIMTITIGAISIGMGIDHSIHYIYRLKEEFSKNKDYTLSINKVHSSIGLAITYTSIVIMGGFSILLLSNLIPTIYFSFLTIIAMTSMLISSLILLPRLLIIFKPFGLQEG